jgi:hypothetical protein
MLRVIQELAAIHKITGHKKARNALQILVAHPEHGLLNQAGLRPGNAAKGGGALAVFSLMGQCADRSGEDQPGEDGQPGFPLTTSPLTAGHLEGPATHRPGHQCAQRYEQGVAGGVK